MYEIEQSNIDSGDITTRLYPVGGTENVIPGEGDEEGRLVLPEKYIENFSETSRVVEKKVVFEGIHPSFIGKVENPTGENKREFVCSTIDFNVEELSVGDEARVNFLTGDLMGKSFEFKWNNDEKKVTLLYQEDDLASIDPETQTKPTIPSAIKHLRGGEEFNFTGIRLGQSYKDYAITLLRDKATDWLNFHCQKRVKFTLSVDYRYMRGKGELKPGDLITVKIPERSINKLIRITSVEKNLKTGKFTCVVSNYLTEKWEDKIEGQISSMQSTINGGSNVGNVTVLEKYDDRVPSEKNVFSSVRSLFEILKNNEELKKIFLSSAVDDEAAGLIKFLQGIISLGDIVAKSGITVGESIIDSLLAGMGIILKDGRIQASRVEIRESLTVMELIFNRLSAMESDYSFSESGTIDSVELLEDGTYNLPLRKRWDNDFTALAENDVVYGVVNDLASGSGNYYTSWLRVLHVDTSANTINAVMYLDSEVPGGKNYPPEPLMILSHRGNPVNVDRQGYWYLSSREKCICMLDGVTKPILEEHNYAVIVGKLKQLSIFDNLPINYLHSYIYCRGIAIQDILRIDYQGIPIVQHNDRGFWTATPDPAYSVSATSADVVWHVGCKWLCLINGTTDEPMYGSTGWAMIEGNPEFTIDIESSAGWNFDMDEIVRLYEDSREPFTVLNVTGRLYNGDVTAHILDGDIEWTRDTGDVTEDNAWAVAHRDTGKVLALSLNDLGPHYSTMTGCKFIARALLRDGQKMRDNTYEVEF